MTILRTCTLFGRLWLLLTVSLVVILWSSSASAQDLSPCSECTCAGDRDGDGKVNIDELVTVVQNALHGCSQFRWYRDCPPRGGIGREVPVCPSNVVFCTEAIGAPCGEPLAKCCQPESHCDAIGRCDLRVVCTDRDPYDPRSPYGHGCRLISRRRFKRDIEYLTPSDLERLRSKLLATNLTRFRYKGESSSRAPHLGFIIEDVEPSPSVDSRNDAVDLYGYVSMAVATIQIQEGEIKALRQELDGLRRQMSRLEEESTQ